MRLVTGRFQLFLGRRLVPTVRSVSSPAMLSQPTRHILARTAVRPCGSSPLAASRRPLLLAPVRPSSTRGGSAPPPAPALAWLSFRLSTPSGRSFTTKSRAPDALLVGQLVRARAAGLPAVPAHRVRPVSQGTGSGSAVLLHAQSLSSSQSRQTNAGADSQPSASSLLSAAPGAGADAAVPALDWTAFFHLRKVRRRFQIVFSVVGFAVSLGAFAAVVGSGAAEPLVSRLPVDPIIAMVILGISCGLFGWLAGPTGGTPLFNWLRLGKLKSQMVAKETEFFTRIKKYRADPSRSSTSNPLPDFYGEKIQSIKGYRDWLRDQRVFDKKRNSFI